ncbi:MAG TPA: DEAD/DEAH box helicase [Oceanospirillales bacterium]|nr:DEAD/DEAH box helicase [Oceanospirillales bacterium]
MKFTAFGFAKEIQKAIEICGYKKMTPVQRQSMAQIRKGRDLLVNAQTGTGKTAAFALPLLQRLLDKPRNNKFGNPQILILTPTRELAEQLANTIKNYAQFLSFNISAIYGGVKSQGQSNKFKTGVDILIATPGRLLEHVNNKLVNLSEVQHVVLDESDRMLDMGFVGDVVQLLEQTNKQRQTLLFSATMTPNLNELAHKVLRNHLEIRTSKKVNKAADTVKHVLYPVDEDKKIDLFMELLQQYNWFQVLVFTSTKRQADNLLERLKNHKIKAGLVHGDKSQGSRRRALADFKSAKLQVLVSTEIAARGLDIIGLDCVVNYNLPFLAEDYVHRIGRTGRAGNSGLAISFASPEESKAVKKIERIIGEKIQRIYKKGYEINENALYSPRFAKKSKPTTHKKRSFKQKSKIKKQKVKKTKRKY